MNIGGFEALETAYSLVNRPSANPRERPDPDLKTVERKLPGFESQPLRQRSERESAIFIAETGPLCPKAVAIRGSNGAHGRTTPNGTQRSPAGMRIRLTPAIVAATERARDYEMSAPLLEDRARRRASRGASDSI